MRYGQLVSRNLINRVHAIYEFNGDKVADCSTAKKWNNEVFWYNKYIVILKKVFEKEVTQ